MLNTAPAPSIGVTMYHCRATGRLLCEKHRDACCTYMPLFRQAHAAFTTLSSEGCAVCRAVPTRYARAIASVQQAAADFRAALAVLKQQ